MIVLFTVPRLLALLIVSRDMSGLLKAWKSKCWFIVGSLLLICRRHYGMAFSTSAFLPFLAAHFLFSTVPSVDPSPIRHIQPPRNQHFYRKQALPEYHQ